MYPTKSSEDTRSFTNASGDSTQLVGVRGSSCVGSRAAHCIVCAYKCWTHFGRHFSLCRNCSTVAALFLTSQNTAVHFSSIEKAVPAHEFTQRMVFSSFQFGSRRFHLNVMADWQHYCRAQLHHRSRGAQLRCHLHPQNDEISHHRCLATAASALAGPVSPSKVLCPHRPKIKVLYGNSCSFHHLWCEIMKQSQVYTCFTETNGPCVRRDNWVVDEKTVKSTDAPRHMQGSTSDTVWCSTDGKQYGY